MTDFLRESSEGRAYVSVHVQFNVFNGGFACESFFEVIDEFRAVGAEVNIGVLCGYVLYEGDQRSPGFEYVSE